LTATGTRLRHTALALAILASGVTGAHAQRISIDQGLRAGGLWCFPLVDEPLVYVYLPSGARLASDDAGRPQFSFIRYTMPAAPSSGGATITQSAGGGVLHFLVELHTPEQAIDEAQRGLRTVLENEEVRLRGPIVFEDGRYSLVSSILLPGGGQERALLAAGRAPVLEGNRLAFSFELDPQRATLLLESFQMPTPDVSLVFDMTFRGLNDAYDAELEIDWSEVRTSHSFSAGGTVYFVSADVEAAIEEMRRNNTIRLVTRGEDSQMEGLLQTVYAKLLELLFRPVEPEQVPEGQRGGLMDALGTMIDNRGGALSARKTVGFGAYVGYQLKDIRSEGKSTLDFNHRSSVERHSFVTFNIGALHQRYGGDPAYFRTAAIDGVEFQQREIRVGIDGALLADFDRYVNNVTVTLRKVHGSGEQTLRETVLDRSAVENSAGDIRLIYGWNGDSDRLAWLRYETRTRWSFKGGGSYETDWLPSDAAMIEVFAPYERRVVQLAGDPDRLAELGVRVVVVRIEYPFFDGPRRQQLVVRAGQPIDDKTVEITLPRNEFDYHYAITWQLDGNRRLTSSGADSTGVIFVDELPTGDPASPGPGGAH
jgi:hypothetical protein